MLFRTHLKARLSLS